MITISAQLLIVTKGFKGNEYFATGAKLIDMIIDSQYTFKISLNFFYKQDF